MKYNKYRNKWTKCRQNHNHQSAGEANYCNQLALLKKVGVIDDYKTQHKIELRVNNQLITTHRVDFYVLKPDGKSEVHEYKGCETAVWKIKKKLFEALFPDISYIIAKG